MSCLSLTPQRTKQNFEHNLNLVNIAKIYFTMQASEDIGRMSVDLGIHSVNL